MFFSIPTAETWHSYYVIDAERLTEPLRFAGECVA